MVIALWPACPSAMAAAGAATFVANGPNPVAFPAQEAKFIRVVVQGAGAKGVAGADKELAGELANLGVPVDPDSKVVWSDSDKDIPRLAKQGKLVICGSRNLMPLGASIGVTAEGGRPVLLVNPKALSATGVVLPDSLIKLAKVAP